MSRYRVTVTFRGQKSFDIEAAGEQEAQELAAEQWEGSPIRRASDNADILSIKSKPAAEGTATERPHAPKVMATPVEPTSGGKASEATIEAEVTEVGAETPVEEADFAAFKPPVPSKRSLLPYLWTAFWIGVLVLLAQLGSR
jgi:hypothetical protein